MPTTATPGQPAPTDILIDVDKLLAEFHDRRPDYDDPQQRVSFGTSGHRGTTSNGSFTQAHILAITQAICDYRSREKISGPLYMGKDTHALSRPAEQTALEVLAANGVATLIQADDAYTPTPVISHAILGYNRNRSADLADGIVITPSHNPPSDGGFKYNTPNGGPADTNATQWIQDRANELLQAGNTGVQRVTFEAALNAATTQVVDFAEAYIAELDQVVDMTVIRNAGLRLGADPLGGASVHYWSRIAEKFGLNLTVVNTAVDPQFGFMTVDHDGKIRMDCSSPHAMAGLVKLKDDFDIAFGNDPDSDRHGIVTPSAGLMNPNHYLSVAVNYLFANRTQWPKSAAIGKTLVSSSMLNRVANRLERRLVEVPVGFKWFVDGLYDGSLGFGGEESAGASFLRQDGRVWSTDKDGIILNLLAAEITANTGIDPGDHYRKLTEEFGESFYTRVDEPATPAEKDALKKLSPAAVSADTLAGEAIRDRLTKAPGNQAPIGGLKVVTDNGWFAARPSGTENIYKIYAESFNSPEHLANILTEAKEIVATALKNAQ